MYDTKCWQRGRDRATGLPLQILAKWYSSTTVHNHRCFIIGLLAPAQRAVPWLPLSAGRPHARRLQQLRRQRRPGGTNRGRLNRAGSGRAGPARGRLATLLIPGSARPDPPGIRLPRGADAVLHVADAEPARASESFTRKHPRRVAAPGRNAGAVRHCNAAMPAPAGKCSMAAARRGSPARGLTGRRGLQGGAGPSSRSVSAATRHAVAVGGNAGNYAVERLPLGLALGVGAVRHAELGVASAAAGAASRGGGGGGRASGL